MAKLLETFEFTRGSAPKYPIDQWLDGNIWELKRGEDFDVKTTTLRARLSRAAKAKGMKVSAKVVDEDTFVIQAVKV